MSLRPDLRSVVRDTFALTGDGFLRRLVCHLAGAADFRYAFVSGPADATPGASMPRQTYGVWLAEEYGVRFQFRAADRRGLGAGLAELPDPGLLEKLFAGDYGLAGLASRSCRTVPLQSARGRLLGHLGVLEPGPAAAARKVDRLLGVLAPRASAEMERLARERTYRRALARLMARRRRIELVLSCAWCKQLHDGRNGWLDPEAYLHRRFGLGFTHGICSACLQRHPQGEPPIPSCGAGNEEEKRW